MVLTVLIGLRFVGENEKSGREIDAGVCRNTVSVLQTRVLFTPFRSGHSSIVEGSAIWPLKRVHTRPSFAGVRIRYGSLLDTTAYLVSAARHVQRRAYLGGIIRRPCLHNRPCIELPTEDRSMVIYSGSTQRSHIRSLTARSTWRVRAGSTRSSFPHTISSWRASATPAAKTQATKTQVCHDTVGGRHPEICRVRLP